MVPAIVGLIVFCASSMTADTVSDDLFTVVFPGKPVRTSKQLTFEGVGAVQAHTFFLQGDALTFGFTYWDYPRVPPDAERALDQVGDRSIKTSGGPHVLMSEAKTTLAGFPGREYRWGRKKTVRMIHRTHLVKERLYWLVVVGYDDESIDRKEAVTAFIRSFAPRTTP